MSRKSSHRRMPSRCAVFECLEDRRMLAAGIFIENFSHDFASFQTYQDVKYATSPGFDSWDNDPATQPPAADELHIINDLPPIDLSAPTVPPFPPLSVAIPGGYAGFGLEKLDPQDPASPSVHVLSIVDLGNSGLPEVTFGVEPVGSPGGLQAGETITNASVDVRGVGTVTFIGQNDSRRVVISNPQNISKVSAFHDHIGVMGRRLGPIQSIKLQSEDVLHVDNVTFLVLDVDALNHPAVALTLDGGDFANDLGVLPPGARNHPGPFRWRAAYDVDGDPLTATLTTPPLHGTVRFRSLPPDETGRSWLEAHYVPYHPHYGPYDGSLKFNDRFAFDVTDWKHYNPDGTLVSDRGFAEILQPNYIELIARNDHFTFNADQPIDPARPGWLIIDEPGVLANDDAFAVEDHLDPFVYFPFRPIYAELLTLPETGTLRFRDNGSFEYLPDPVIVALNDAYAVSFTYRVTDGLLSGQQATATVTLRITTNRLPESQRWSNLIARSDHVLATPDPNGFPRIIDVTALTSNDVYWDPRFVDPDHTNARFPSVNGAVDWGVLQSNIIQVPNGNYVEFVPLTANSLFDFTTTELLAQELQIEDRPPFEGITFGRYRLAIKDGVNLKYSNWANFYVHVPPVDIDGDGVSDTTQSDVVRIPNSIDRRIVSLSTKVLTHGLPSPLEARFQDVSARDSLPEADDPPAGVEFPIGFFKFSVISPSSDATVVVRIEPPPGVQLTAYWKFGLEPDDPNTTDDDWKKDAHWYEFTFDEATQIGAKPVNGGAIELYLRDGQRGDYDLKVDGIIVDPGGPALGTPLLPGDYNIDGSIDTADYVVWRKTLGQSVLNYTFADGNGDAIVDEDDYSVWRANFGRTLSPASGAGAVVEPPAEPGAVGLATESVSIGDSARQLPGLPGGIRSDVALARAAGFAAIEMESPRPGLRPPSRGRVERYVGHSSGDDFLLLAIDRAVRIQQQIVPVPFTRQHNDADDDDEVPEDEVPRILGETFYGSLHCQ